MVGNPRGSAADLPIYSTLEEHQFRILVLDPGEHEDPLHGRLEVVSLSSHQPFSAISYVWGGVCPDSSDGASKSRHEPLSITPSLLGALRRFRKSTEPVTLWADAVCINQQDKVEKGKQVAVMVEIYKEAEEVLVWLDEEVCSDALAFWFIPFLDALAQEAVMETDDEKHFTHPVPDVLERLEAAFATKITDFRTDVPCTICQQTHYPSPPTLREAFDSLSPVWHRPFNRPWFSRLWVLQEAAMARDGKLTYYCGSHCVSFEMLLSAAKISGALICYTETADLIAGTPTGVVVHVIYLLLGVIHAWRVKNYTGEAQHFFDIFMYAVLWLRCTDERDYVFALGALSFVRNDPNLQPDYSVSSSQLWQRLTLSALTRPFKNSLNAAFLLALPATEDQVRRVAQSSWVPDFRAVGTQSLAKYKVYVKQYLNATHWAGGQSELFQAAYRDTDEGVIRVKGIVLSKINLILQSSHQRPDVLYPWFEEDDAEVYHIRTRGNPTELLRWYTTILGFAVQYSSSPSDVIDDFDALLMHGQTFPAVKPVGELWDPVVREWLTDAEIPFQEALPSPDATLLIRKHLTWFMWDEDLHDNIDKTRVLAATADGRIGWVPSTTEEGDVVCLLQGAPFPFVLRDVGGGYYRVVGDAYVQGLSKGEAWPDECERPVTLSLK